MGSPAQRFGGLAAVEIGQGLGGVELHLRIVRLDAFDQDVDSQLADRLQLDRGFGGVTGSSSFVFNLASRNAVWAGDSCNSIARNTWK